MRTKKKVGIPEHKIVTNEDGSVSVMTRILVPGSKVGTVIEGLQKQFGDDFEIGVTPVEIQAQ